MCVLTAVRARVALVSRLSRPPGPGAPPGVTKSRMRIQVPACPRPQAAGGPTRAQRPAAARSREPREPVICAFAVRCRREQADGIPVAETGMPNFDSGYDLRPGYGSVRRTGRYKVVTRFMPFESTPSRHTRHKTARGAHACLTPACTEIMMKAARHCLDHPDL